MEEIKMNTYDNCDCNQFVRDMETAGYKIKCYRGRMFWSGPAVVCKASELQDVIRATSVRLQTDSMGLDLVVYPEKSGKLIDT
jgi:hypothetical protein